MPDKIYLRQMQALPLIAKVHMSQRRIAEWYAHWNGDVCISFSGGKDSTVLAHLVHEYYPDVPLVFVNTGLEYPEIQDFARRMGAEFVRPKMRFDEVISKYGYPIISKENAEAIYYARKIRNSMGGVQTLHPTDETRIIRSESLRRQADITATRESWEDQRQSKRKKLLGGGYFSKPIPGQNRLETSSVNGTDSFQNSRGGVSAQKRRELNGQSRIPVGGV